MKEFSDILKEYSEYKKARCGNGNINPNEIKSLREAFKAEEGLEKERHEQISKMSLMFLATNLKKGHSIDEINDMWLQKFGR